MKRLVNLLTLFQISSLIAFSHAFNYMDYANLYDGIVHLHRAKITGRETLQSSDKNWRAWEFLGVRYGNAERFQPPKFFDDYEMEESPKQNAHVKNGPSCISSRTLNFTEFPNSAHFHEDCLFLNIHLPLVNQDHGQLRTELWPVLVVLGGDYGEFVSSFDENKFSWETDIVLITISYRSGLFGYLSTDDWNARGNWALKDIKMAFKWIQQYINRFGADPDRLFLCGLGSGGGLVPLLMVDDQVRDAISGVIAIDSGPIQQPLESGYALAAKLALTAGCMNSTTSVTVMDCLRKKNLTEILKAERQMRFEMVVSWSPVVDGEDIPYLPFAELRSKLPWIFNGSFLVTMDSSNLSRNKLPTPLNSNTTSGYSMENVTACKGLREFLKDRLPEIFGCSVFDSILNKVEKFYSKTTPCYLIYNKTSEQTDILQGVVPVLLASDLVLNDRLTKGHSVELFDFFVPATKTEEDSRFSLKKTADVFDRKETQKLLAGFIKQRNSFGINFDPVKPSLLQMIPETWRWTKSQDSELIEFVTFWASLSQSACAY